MLELVQHVIYQHCGMGKLALLCLDIILGNQGQHMDIVKTTNQHGNKQHHKISQQIVPKYLILFYHPTFYFRNLPFLHLFSSRSARGSYALSLTIYSHLHHANAFVGNPVLIYCNILPQPAASLLPFYRLHKSPALCHARV